MTVIVVAVLAVAAGAVCIYWGVCSVAASGSTSPVVDWILSTATDRSVKAHAEAVAPPDAPAEAEAELEAVAPPEAVALPEAAALPEPTPAAAIAWAPAFAPEPSTEHELVVKTPEVEDAPVSQPLSATPSISSAAPVTGFAVNMTPAAPRSERTMR